MGLDGRALRQKERERRRLNALIAETDDWIDQRIRYGLTSTPQPADDLDAKGLEAYADQLLSFFDGTMGDLVGEASYQLDRARSRAVSLGASATERLVAAELPSAEEVRRGHADADRSR